MLKQYDVSGGSIMLPRKVYIDAYDYVGSTYPEARKAMYRMLDEGVVWWNFVGHASPTGWTKEGMLSYSDLNSLYLRHWPFIYAATCDFLRLDSRRVSGGELMYLERYGGAIGMISAVRPVYISDNGKLTAAIGRALAEIGKDSAILTPGEIYRRAKNDIRTDDNNSQMSDDNRLRYIFVGDPALPLAMPVNNVRIDTIKGISIADTDVQPTLAALERATISGSVMSNDGSELSDFEGVLLVDIFDSERTVSTNGRGEGTVENFEDIGGRIYTGSAPVKNGHFTLEVAMPAEVAQNFRPAAMSLYAYSTTDDTEAVGLFRNFYVYGYDDSVTPDDKAPVIESMVLNHSDFRSGDAVNDHPDAHCPVARRCRYQCIHRRHRPPAYGCGRRYQDFYRPVGLLYPLGRRQPLGRAQLPHERSNARQAHPYTTGMGHIGKCRRKDYRIRRCRRHGAENLRCIL